MNMKKSFILICSLTLLICFLNLFFLKNICFATSKEAFINNSSSAKSMVVIETTNNSVLYSKNENEKLPMASTTKIVTAITVLENCEDINKEIIIPLKATLVEGSSIYLKENEKLSIKQLLYGLMLQSGNDAAMALALEIGDGSVENFATLMNETAKKVGVMNSNFVTPHGLDAKNHYTTAKDLALTKTLFSRNHCLLQSAHFYS